MDKHLINITLGDESLKNFDLLCTKTGMNRTEVMKNALRLYHAAIDEIEAGRAIFLREKNGEYTMWNIFLSEDQ